jgi:putative ABC transport system permease protein
MILRQGLRPVVCGLAAGLAVAIGTGQILSSLLFQVSARDVTTYALVVAVMLGTAAGACWIPAYRASRFQLIEALRDE